MKHVVIIGNGIAGITAARHIRKQSDHRITVISAESEYFWSRTALMYVYMGHMQFDHTKPYEDSFWRKNKIELIHDFVDTIDHSSRILYLKINGTVNYDELVLATGSTPAFFNWKGQDLEGVSGMVSLQDLENIERLTRNISRAVITGGGLIGIEMAEMLRSRNIEVTFLVREKEFWHNVLPIREAALISRHIREHHVDLRLENQLEEILGDESGKVRAVRTASGEELPCQFVGIATGVRPNISLARASGIPADKGILVNDYLETSIPGIYAIGDCAERMTELPGRKQIEQVWYTGRMMGETVASTICGQRRKYSPGPWFNSAKFFDIEYQTYGNVPDETETGPGSFYWEHPGGRHAVRFVFDADSGKFTGMNSLGIRFRHEMFDQWLRKDTCIQTVMEQIPAACFDPELFADHTLSIRNAFNQEYPDFMVRIKRKKLFGIL